MEIEKNTVVFMLILLNQTKIVYIRKTPPSPPLSSHQCPFDGRRNLRDLLPSFPLLALSLLTPPSLSFPLPSLLTGGRQPSPATRQFQRPTRKRMFLLPTSARFGSIFFCPRQTTFLNSMYTRISAQIFTGYPQ